MKLNLSSVTMIAALAAAVALAGCKKDEPVVDPNATTPPPMSEPAPTTPAPTVPAAMTVTTVDMGTEVGTDNRVTVPAASFAAGDPIHARSEEQTSELQSLMRNPYA